MEKMVQEFLDDDDDDDDVAADTWAESPATHFLCHIDNEKCKQVFSISIWQYATFAGEGPLHGRPDLLTAVSFSTTRVNFPNEADYKKLKSFSSYLNANNLILKANLPFQLHCYVDASYAVHVDGKRRTGNVVTLNLKIMSKNTIVTKS